MSIDLWDFPSYNYRLYGRLRNFTPFSRVHTIEVLLSIDAGTSIGFPLSSITSVVQFQCHRCVWKIYLFILMTTIEVFSSQPAPLTLMIISPHTHYPGMCLDLTSAWRHLYQGIRLRNYVLERLPQLLSVSFISINPDTSALLTLPWLISRSRRNAILMRLPRIFGPLNNN